MNLLSCELPTKVPNDRNPNDPLVDGYVPTTPGQRANSYAFSNGILILTWSDESYGEDGFRITKRLSSNGSAKYLFYLPKDATIFQDETGLFDLETYYDVAPFSVTKDDTTFADPLVFTVSGLSELQVTSTPTQTPLNTLSWNQPVTSPIAGFRITLKADPELNRDTTYVLPPNRTSQFLHQLFKLQSRQYTVKLESFLYNGIDTIMVDEIEYLYSSSNVDFNIQNITVIEPRLLEITSRISTSVRSPLELSYTHDGKRTTVVALTDTVPSDAGYGNQKFQLAIPEKLSEFRDYTFEYRPLYPSAPRSTKSVQIRAEMPYHNVHPNVSITNVDGDRVELAVSNFFFEPFDLIIYGTWWNRENGAVELFNQEIERIGSTQFNNSIIARTLSMPTQTNQFSYEFRFEFSPTIKKLDGVWGFSKVDSASIRTPNQATNHYITKLLSYDDNKGISYISNDRTIYKMEMEKSEVTAIHEFSPVNESRHFSVGSYYSTNISQNHLVYFYDGRVIILDKNTLSKVSEHTGFIDRAFVLYTKYFENEGKILYELRDGTVHIFNVQTATDQVVSMNKTLIPSNYDGNYALAFSEEQNAFYLLNASLEPVKTLNNTTEVDLSGIYGGYSHSAKKFIVMGNPITEREIEYSFVLDFEENTIRYLYTAPTGNLQEGVLELTNLPWLNSNNKVFYHSNENRYSVIDLNDQFSSTQVAIGSSLGNFTTTSQIVGFVNNGQKIYALGEQRNIVTYSLQGLTLSLTDNYRN